MIESDAPLFGRMITAMVTPFDDDDRLDLGAVERVANHLIETGTSCILVAGTTGESPTLTDSERIEILKTTLGVAKGRAKVIVGTGSNNTAKSIKASIDAQAEGADGLLIVAPYYNKPSQKGIEAHVQAVARETSVPIIVYNIPGRTGININADTMARMGREIPSVHAVKESSGNVDQVAEIARAADSDFRVYSGDDYLTLPFLSVGACGVVSVASHIVGAKIREMIDAYFDGNVEKAQKLHLEYLPVFKGIFAAPNPTCIKYALSKLGLCSAKLRLPLVPLDDSEASAMDSMLEKSGILSEKLASRG